MKAADLLMHAKCSVCLNPIGHTQLPLFWVVRVERHGIDLRAVQRHDGLAMMLGSAHLAEIMGPDEELTQPVMEAIELTVCERCMMERLPELADLVFRSNEDDQAPS
jgi:hypothetical protein